MGGGRGRRVAGGGCQAAGGGAFADSELLGTKLTPMGADPSASADGVIPAWTGGLTTPPADYVPGQPHIDPFADDGRLFTISHENLNEYAKRLPATQIELLTKFAGKYVLNVYPTRRSCAFPDSVYAANKRNADKAQLVKGGVGFSKTAANYAAALYPAVKAQNDGYHQLIWTDGKSHEYVEESGTMNLFFVIEDKLVTPPLGDTVLDGVTRDSIIKLSKLLKIDVEVRKVSVSEVINNLQEGTMIEAFGAGTAATIAPIKSIGYKNKKYNLPSITKNSISNTLLKKLNDIKFREDMKELNWLKTISL